MMYLVMYFEGYVGNHITDDMKLFSNKEKAEEYAHALNVDCAIASDCEVEDLGDWFEVIPLDVSEF